ncbi:hypothetical protein FIBSPDRAFT_865389 [Athelia psychrophila]|uniref:H-type lectin domain-containing protein n=1 Tax=Athelia psychrophila TaxID=1759441 RepID=A0A166FQL7_9AGAM|nr:hypothetical protein FIBSPDRAFT_865389 [Fibularhizoctonia sp. CBS 109695]
MAVLAVKSAIERTSHCARLSPDIPSTTIFAVGKFDVTEVRAWQNPTTKTHKSITFSKPFVVPPGLPIGLNTLNIDAGANIRVTSSASDITKTGFVVHVDCWLETKLYSAGVSWLEVGPGDLECQHGQFGTTDVHPRNMPQAQTSRRINFARPYVTPPKVISFLTSLDMARDRNWRITTKVTGIDKKGFTIHIDTWLNTILYSGRVGWIAYPEDRPFVYSGTADVTDVRACTNTVANNSKAIDFGGTQFWKTPSVFVALNSLDLGCGRNLRLRAFVDNVSTSGMTWHIDTWSDSVLYGGGISYLAFCDSAMPV